MHLSKLSYYGDFVICMVLISISAAMAAMYTWTNMSIWLFAVVLGFVIWTFLEYVIHRWIYHQVPYFKERHAAHHADPDADIGAPPVIGIVLIFLVFYVPLATSGTAIANGVTTGVLLGYSAYMLVHHADHHWTSKPGSWLYAARRQHALHHHNSELGHFGITSTLWDRVLGTAAIERPLGAKPSNRVNL